MATYLNKNMIDGVEELPRLTQEEFLAIPIAERPRAWAKRNATETDRGITAEDVQYDSSNNVKQKIDSVNSNVPQMIQMQFALPSSTTIPSRTTVVVLNHFDITNSSIQDGLHDNKPLSELLGGKKILGFVFLYANSSVCCGVDAIVWEDENTINLAINNVSSASAEIWAIRLLVFYK